MSGLFKRNNNEPSVNEETREWIENCFLWFINSFGKDTIKKRKVLIPDYKDFPIVYNGKQQAAFDTLKIVATQMEIDADNINLVIYNEGQQEIDSGNLFGGRIFLQSVKDQKYSGGVYLGKQEDGKYLIGLEDKNLKDPLAIVASLAHELSHIKLLGEKRIRGNNEHLTDLTTIIFGLGVFNANAAFQTINGYGFSGWSKLGYLTQMQWGYALALFCYLREEENPEWVKFLSVNVQADFKKSITFIQNNPGNIFVQKDKVLKSRPKNEDASKIHEAKKNKDFEEIISIYKKQLHENPNNRNLYNSIGYTLLQQKNYKEAIDYFNTAINIAPKWDFPYNNRGYCKLQLGDLKGAYIDIRKACEMNPFNSFAWRNLGAYYLKINEFEKALENFEEAEKINDRTELINFYLGKAHEKLGNQEKAQDYFSKSIALNEYLDIPNE
ncbi:MAG TPA: tetratricopeptide repeat protein [Chitinophagaceae bacterium]|nr:tetratricopeptide repeat protein [Chitinophagaceae bacterium]